MHTVRLEDKMIVRIMHFKSDDIFCNIMWQYLGKKYDLLVCQAHQRRLQSFFFANSLQKTIIISYESITVTLLDGFCHWNRVYLALFDVHEYCSNCSLSTSNRTMYNKLMRSLQVYKVILYTHAISQNLPTWSKNSQKSQQIHSKCIQTHWWNKKWGNMQNVCLKSISFRKCWQGSTWISKLNKILSFFEWKKW